MFMEQEPHFPVGEDWNVWALPILSESDFCIWWSAGKPGLQQNQLWQKQEPRDSGFVYPTPVPCFYNLRQTMARCSHL